MPCSLLRNVRASRASRDELIWTKLGEPPARIDYIYASKDFSDVGASSSLVISGFDAIALATLCVHTSLHAAVFSRSTSLESDLGLRALR